MKKGEYKSTKADKNAISVSGNVTSTLSNISVTKTRDSDGGDNTSFYGTNPAITLTGNTYINRLQIQIQQIVILI